MKEEVCTPNGTMTFFFTINSMIPVPDVTRASYNVEVGLLATCSLLVPSSPAHQTEGRAETDIQIHRFGCCLLPCSQARAADQLRNSHLPLAGANSKEALLTPRIHVDPAQRRPPLDARDALGVTHEGHHHEAATGLVF